MTREERLDWLYRLRRDISYVDFSIDMEVSLKRQKQYKQVLSEVIKVLEQESILDKITAEIKELDTYYVNDFYIGNMDAMLKRDYVLQILDKYKAEDENP